MDGSNNLRAARRDWTMLTVLVDVAIVTRLTYVSPSGISFTAILFINFGCHGNKAFRAFLIHLIVIGHILMQKYRKLYEPRTLKHHWKTGCAAESHRQHMAS